MVLDLIVTTILLIIFLPKNKTIRYKPIIPNEYEASLLIAEKDNKCEIDFIRKDIEINNLICNYIIYIYRRN